MNNQTMEALMAVLPGASPPRTGRRAGLACDESQQPGGSWPENPKVKRR
jgi:hypothetical protein